MESSLSFGRTRRQLQQKNARLKARRRLLFKREHIYQDDVMPHRCRLLAREARQLRSTLMRLRRTHTPHLENQHEHKNLISAHNIHDHGNSSSVLVNIISLLMQESEPHN